MTYFPKQKLRSTAEFKDADGVAAEPASITLTITRFYAGEETAISTKSKTDLQNPAVGTYYYEYTPGTDGAGTYYFNWVSTSPYTENEESVVVETPHR